ncbi:MAG: FtsQ-type POTRA domain-containing protein [Clostridia bacterium]
MKKVRPREPQQKKEDFEAYGEYSYEYLHKATTKEEVGQLPRSSYEPPVNPIVKIEAAKRARTRHKTHTFFKLLALLSVLTVTLVVVQATVFRLETVYIIGNKQLTAQQVVMASGLVSGRNIFSINEAEVEKALSSNHTIIFNGMQKEYPHTVYLYISERETVAVMQWLGIRYALDSGGIVMSEESTKNVRYEGLPIVTGFRVSNANVGQQLMVRSQKQMDAYCAIMSELALQRYADQITEINLADADNIYLITREGVTVRLGDAKYMQAKIGAVRTDMAYLRQLGKVSGILDVSIPEDAKYLPDN